VRTAGGNRVRRSTPLSGRELDGGGDRSLPEPLRRAQRFGLTPDVYTAGPWLIAAAAVLVGIAWLRLEARRFQAAWDTAMRCYVAANAWRIADPSDLKAALSPYPAAIGVLQRAGALR